VRAHANTRGAFSCQYPTGAPGLSWAVARRMAIEEEKILESMTVRNAEAAAQQGLASA
jgi:hypothetical protein